MAGSLLKYPYPSLSFGLSVRGGSGSVRCLVLISNAARFRVDIQNLL
jgi:hypothetical protein